jgi:hypothetical protein
MKTPDLKPDWAAEDLPEQGQEDLRLFKQFGGGPFDVTAGLAAFEERVAKVQPGPTWPARRLLVGALVLSGVAVTMGFAMRSEGTPPSTRTPIATMPAPVPPTPPELAADDTAAQAITPTPSIPSVSIDSLPTVASPHARPAPLPAVAAAPPVATSQADVGDPIEAEVRHASRLRIMARTDPRGALSLAAEGDQLFPSGLLHAEREAIAIEALARLDRWNEARARAEAFASAYPTHPRTGRILAIAKGERPWEL